MFFSDIHVHLLYGVDDGAKTPEEMYAMADKLYADGVRFICATPHCYPQWCGDNRISIENAFSRLCEYCAQKYPDLKITLGNELYFERDGMTWIKNGFCKTMNGTRYILVEFPVDETEDNITKAVQSMLNAGYVPVIAHTERYIKLSIKKIKEFHQSGVVIQINARRDLCGFDFIEKSRLKRLLSLELADVVSTDAHDLGERAPYILEFYNIVSKKYGVGYAEKIFCTNAEMMLCNGNGEERK